MKRRLESRRDAAAQITSLEIVESLRSDPPTSLADWRRRRRGWSRALRTSSPEAVVRLSRKLVDAAPWGRITAYELIASHPTAVGALSRASVRALGRGLTDWGAVDAFACYVSGPAWREGYLASAEIHAWLRSRDRWWRRAAVVSTVALNVRARGGMGDPTRTLDVCGRVVDDHDDMIVKALSWALRALVSRDGSAVARFLDEHDARLAARVKREVRHKLATGRKN